MSTAVASVVTSGDLAGTCQHFGEMHLLHLQRKNREKEENKLKINGSAEKCCAENKVFLHTVTKRSRKFAFRKLRCCISCQFALTSVTLTFTIVVPQN
jgi:hypothetical protein